MTQALDYHEFPRPGKLAIAPTKPLTTQHDLALAYSPGVAEACMAIAEDPASASRFTARGNLVAVISNGTAVLGLGNIGPLAAKPVMEGKAVLFKKFADIDVFDIEVCERDPEKLAEAIAVLEPTFGAINLEDIKAPECFIVEERLRARMKIPVLHDDQHGTAIVVGATVLNALRCVAKRIEEIRIVSTGGGAAGIACLNLLVSMGARRANIVLVDHQGVVYAGRSEDMTPQKALYARETTARTLAEAIPDADIFLGLSAPGILTADMVRQMAPRPMILALANPVPEIMPDIAKTARPDAVIATGRSDFPNQVNNLLCFPFIFRGALDVGATEINEEMKLACVRALADLAMQESSDIVARAYGGEELVFGPEYLIPKPFDPRLLVELAPAVARAAMDSGVATRPIEDLAAYGDRLARFVYRSQMLMKPVFEQAKRNPKRVVYAEGEDERVLRAVQTVLHDGLAEPILIGRPSVIKQRCEHLGLKIRAGADFAICNPEDYPRYPEYAEFYHRRMERSGVSPTAARAIMRTNPTAIAAVMLKLGEADALLCGSYGQYAWHLRYVLNVIDKKPVGAVAALSALVLPSGTYFFTDTYVNPDPTAAELVEITLLAAEEVSRLGIKPKVALISHSNFGNADTPSARKMRDAVRMLHERAPDLDVEGEMHADAAINETIRNRVFPHSRLQGSANLLVMPTLDAANSAFNLAKVLGEGLHVGPMLLGITRPAHIVTPSVTARGIVNVTALAVVDAQADRRDDQIPTASPRPSRGELLAEAREVAHGE
jgi:malate dehydrogenase (oxaloacetate-decarboxylating)(NADP+)